jgi:hypothetical protein
MQEQGSARPAKIDSTNEHHSNEWRPLSDNNSVLCKGKRELPEMKRQLPQTGNYWPVHLGARFSAKAWAPSRASEEEKTGPVMAS